MMNGEAGENSHYSFQLNKRMSLKSRFLKINSTIWSPKHSKSRKKLGVTVSNVVMPVDSTQTPTISTTTVKTTATITSVGAAAKA